MRRSLLLFLAAAVLLLGGCGRYPWPLTENALDVAYDVPGFTFAVQPGSVTAEGCEAAIKNITDKEFTYGSRFLVQILLDGVWYDITGEETMWTEECRICSPGGDYTESFNWMHIYGKLPAGTYRVVRQFSGYDSMSESFITRWIGSDFVID